MVTTPKRKRVRRCAWCLCREFEGVNPKSLHLHPKHKIRVRKHPSIIQGGVAPWMVTAPKRRRVKRRARYPWMKVRKKNPKSLLSRLESKKWRRKHSQNMTHRSAGLWMLIAPKRLRVRRRAWCLRIENEKGYKMDSCFVENNQYLKEISSFEAADGVSWR